MFPRTIQLDARLRLSGAAEECLNSEWLLWKPTIDGRIPVRVVLQVVQFDKFNELAHVCPLNADTLRIAAAYVTLYKAHFIRKNAGGAHAVPARAWFLNADLGKVLQGPNVTSPLQDAFDETDVGIAAYERRIRDGEDLSVGATTEQAIAWVTRLMDGYAEERSGQRIAEDGVDVLEIFKRFVKGDPSFNAIRDNIRELVYYRNCVAAYREDALPKKPAVMAVRTARHIYLYLRTRSLQEKRLPEA